MTKSQYKFQATSYNSKLNLNLKKSLTAKTEEIVTKS